MDNYEKLLERISKASKLEKEEIERKIEAKKAKLSGLISKEGAAQIVAAELGINFDQERLKISEIVSGMKRANVIGKVIKIDSIREYNKNGKQGKVANLWLADETSNIRVVLWDTNHIALIENGKIKEGSVIEISNGSMRNAELHLASFSDIKISKEEIENVVLEKEFSEKRFKDAKSGENLKSRAVIVNAFDPKYFEVCPECSKKAVEKKCETHGSVVPVKRALVGIVLDDGTETMRSTLFMEQIKNLGITEEEIFITENHKKLKSKILGEEKFFSGQLRNNSLFNRVEFSISKIEEISPSELVTQLEAKLSS
ncbi:DUF2240 family protein [Candidatus Pacearchaeota archaeon]|nr:DUF2240 family protein [Candidatus Pacearchaeota archaeon]